jgi:rhodanese-related sulfurtransferase
VAQTLIDHGYNAKALLGGFEAWEEKGLPVEPKSAPAKL